LTDVKRSGRDESNRNAWIVNGYLNGREQTSGGRAGKSVERGRRDFSFKKHASYSGVMHSFVCQWPIWREPCSCLVKHGWPGSHDRPDFERAYTRRGLINIRMPTRTRTISIVTRTDVYRMIQSRHLFI